MNTTSEMTERELGGDQIFKCIQSKTARRLGVFLKHIGPFTYRAAQKKLDKLIEKINPSKSQ